MSGFVRSLRSQMLSPVDPYINCYAAFETESLYSLVLFYFFFFAWTFQGQWLQGLRQKYKIKQNWKVFHSQKLRNLKLAFHSFILFLFFFLQGRFKANGSGAFATVTVFEPAPPLAWPRTTNCQKPGWPPCPRSARRWKRPTWQPQPRPRPQH